MNRRVWVIEGQQLDGRWLPARTISLRPAVYATRADARRDIYNREVCEARVRVRPYIPARAN